MLLLLMMIEDVVSSLWHQMEPLEVELRDRIKLIQILTI
jgi:hypothetical protein